jgi:hypothetical protein
MACLELANTSLPMLNAASDHHAMIPDLDIWRCAQLMINNHGDEAALEASATADEWLAKGNIEAQGVWMPIARAIDELQTVTPGEARQ